MNLKWAVFAATLVIIFYSISGIADESLRFGKFGIVSLHQPKGAANAVVLFLSSRPVENDAITAQLTGDGALVVGIDAPRYIRMLGNGREKCSYPAADFEALSKYVQKKRNLSHYIQPTLISDSIGATIAYGALAQAPPNTFAGAITIGFCPRWNAPRLCKGYGFAQVANRLIPPTALGAPWLALRDQSLKTCNEKEVSTFVKQIKNAEFIPNAALSQLNASFLRLTQHSEKVAQKEKELRPAEVKDLPLIEVEAQGDTSQDPLALILTGDGGWASIDRDIGNALADRGIPVVGFNSLQYFWNRHSPDDAAHDVERVLRHYLSFWHKEKAILIGYSFGADVLPFVLNRLPADLQQRVSVAALLGPSRTADFEFHLTDWIGGVTHKNDRDVLPEINKMQANKVLCLYGEDEEDSICKSLHGEEFRSIQVPGGHHFGGAFRSLADLILKK